MKTNGKFTRHIIRRQRMSKIFILKPLAKLFYYLDRFFFSCDIPNECVIGDNVWFPHLALGVVIHKRVRIGNNCKIYQNVTIGCRNKGDVSYGPPMIGNNVLIGTGSCILGDIKIGNNVKIGAGSIVVSDIPDNATVVGNPGKVIKVNNGE